MAKKLFQLHSGRIKFTGNNNNSDLFSFLFTIGPVTRQADTYQLCCCYYYWMMMIMTWCTRLLVGRNGNKFTFYETQESPIGNLL